MADGSGPRFSRLDDVPWEEVRKIDFGDHTASVREKWLDFSPRFLSLLAQWDPGMIVQPTVTTATTSSSCSRAT